MNKCYHRAVIVILLVTSILLFCVSCTFNQTLADNVFHTDYNVFSSADSIELDFSPLSGIEILDAALSGDDIVVLTSSTTGFNFLFYSQKGELLRTSESISLADDDLVFEIYSPNENTVCLATGKYAIIETQDGYLFHDIELRSFDRNGSLQSDSVTIERDFEANEPGVAFTKDGNIYVACDTKVYCYRRDGSLVYENDYGVDVDLFLMNNRPVISSYKKILPVAQWQTNLGDGYEVEPLSSLTNVSNVNGLFLANSAGVFAFDFSRRESVKIMSWNDTNLGSSTEVIRTYILSNSVFLVQSLSSDGSDKLTIILPSTESSAGEVSESSNITEITIAGFGISDHSYLSYVIQTYCDKHPDVSIQIRDYLDEYGGERGKSQMSIDILTDDAADIYYYTPYDFEIDDRLAFVDLKTITSTDPTFSKNDFYWDIVESTEKDGQLFRFPLCFSVAATIGPKSIIGDISAWTLSEYMNYDDSLPSGSILYSGGRPSEIFSDYLSSNYRAFIDPQTGTIDFSTSLFTDALDYAERFSFYDEKTREQKISEVNCLIHANIYDFPSYVDAITTMHEPFTIIGYPENNGVLKANPNMLLSLSSTTKNQDIAWDILKFCLSEEMQVMTDPNSESGIYGIPLNRNALQVQMDGLLERASEDSLLTESNSQDFLLWLDDISATTSFDKSIWTIVQEEAPAYFTGQKSAEELAAVLENRIGLLLAERGD